MLFQAPTPTPHSMHFQCFDESEDYVELPSAQEVDELRMKDMSSDEPDPHKMPEPVFNVKRRSDSSDDYALSFSSESRSVDKGKLPSLSAALEDARNERRYRYLLEHDYNSSRE